MQRYTETLIPGFALQGHTAINRSATTQDRQTRSETTQVPKPGLRPIKKHKPGTARLFQRFPLI
jgi:hypothetical protein